MLSVETIDRDCFITVKGDLDILNAPYLAQVFRDLDHADNPVFLDLQECDYIDSTAISVMVKVRKERGSRFRVLIRDGGNVARVLTLCGLHQLLCGGETA